MLFSAVVSSVVSLDNTQYKFVIRFYIRTYYELRAVVKERREVGSSPYYLREVKAKLEELRVHNRRLPFAW